jgi:hypothetical protein
MGTGKIFCILGGIVTLVAMYIFSFGDFPFLPGTYFYSIGFMLNIPNIFGSGQILWIILAIVGIIFLVSGIFIILGVKSRVIAIIGSIFAIGMGVYFILTIFLVLPAEAGQFIALFLYPALVDGIVPFHFGLGSTAFGSVGLGSYLLVGGGVLGLIGGIIGPDTF